MGRRVAVRILGIASTTKGFAYAVTEGPRRLVLWGMTKGRGVTISTALDHLMKRSRPLFVAFDHIGTNKKSIRGRLFSIHLGRACALHKVLILQAEARRVVSKRMPFTKWDIASAMARDFPELVRHLPARRKPWQSEDDRIGIFMALATGLAAWRSFRPEAS